MSVITRVPEPNLFEEICKEFESRRTPIDDDQASVATDYQDFDPGKHNPVFYGCMHARIATDFDLAAEIDVGATHPSVIGYAFLEKPPKAQSPQPPPPPNKDTCPPREYLEYYVFPYLLPSFAEMLKKAKEEKCFERKRTRFNALDFITEYLYRKNPRYTGREETDLWDIPFVKEWLKEHPRPPLPLSLVWTEEEAVLIIQSHWRGYVVRREPEVQELRQWQREWREINGNIKNQVTDFWDRKMPGGDVTPSASEDRGDGSVISAFMRPPSPLPDSATPTSGFATAPPSRISAPSVDPPLSTLAESSPDRK
ncbi:hypothetical protein BaRGS_00000842 [Batillaria attramentaria]|uniref:IQ domain-containing protein K n=1 Tax=Batillaria attramentaria TaxID=370345 RepID=A0ABD0M8K6_9CAEN